MGHHNDRDRNEVVVTAWLLAPPRLWSAAELVDEDQPPPRPGVYGWYFDALPGTVPTCGCHRVGGFALAYVGIAPKAPPAAGRASRQTLRSRVRYHLRGNAEGSTLRLTLGCLLGEELGLELRRVGSGRRLTFHEGEVALTAWLAAHARVVFTEHPRPWTLEEQLISELCLPLNLAGNESHPHHAALSVLRAACKRRARALPVVR